MQNIHAIVREQVTRLKDETYRGRKERRHISVGVGFQARVMKCADLMSQYGYDVTSLKDPDGIHTSRVVEIAVMLFLAEHGFDKDLQPLPHIVEGNKS